MQQEKVREALEQFSKRVITEARSNLTRQKKNVSKVGYDSLNKDLEVYSTGNFSLAFLMEEYMQYQDQGVKGSKSTYSESKNSPFRYTTKAPPSSVFEKWIRQRGIQGRNKKGQFITNKSLAYLISRSIFNKGIKGSMFFTRPFETNYKKLPDELVEAFGLDLETFITFTNGNNIR